jgi:threonine 3-dehydrogenase
MKCSLVVGGSGFLGGYLVRRLLLRGERVVVLDGAGTRPLAGVHGSSTLHVVKGTTADRGLLLSILANEAVDAIFHVGSMVPPASEEDLFHTFESNVVGTAVLLEAARLRSLRSVVYAGSQSLFGNTVPALVDEAQPRRPWTMYGTCKVCEELLGQQYACRHGLDFRGIIFPPLVGPGRTKYGLSGFQGWTAGGFAGLVLDFVARGEPYTFNVLPTTTVPSAVYVRDAARSLIMLRDAPSSLLSHKMYVLHGLSINVGAMCEAIRRLRPNAQLEFSPDPRVVELVSTWPKLDDAAARRDWGWFAEYGNEDALVRDFLDTLAASPELGTLPRDELQG